ncbi:MAG: hypothetical protein EA427_06095 [Spirochaetaceae bacterium]|nr:MAG: hypothetical protein EA427_06095 [Spirochaetaceae bacterium]
MGAISRKTVDVMDESPVVLSNHLILHFLDTSVLSGKDRDTILDNEMLRWLWYLSATGSDREDPRMREIIDEIIAREPELEKVARRYEEILSDPILLERIEAREKARRDRVAETKLAQEQGHADGFRQGIEKGEEKAKLEIAQRMIDEQYTAPEIVRFTGLTNGRVAELQAEGRPGPAVSGPEGAG